MLERTVIVRLPAALVSASLMLTSPSHASGKPTGTVYNHTDHLGSTVAVSEQEAGVSARLAWSPYGTPRIASRGPEAAEPARFTGKPWAKSTALTYFGARYHDAVFGRFLSPDAARQASSPYAYVGAAPLERVDPDGNVYTGFVKLLRDAAQRERIVLDTPANRLKAAYLAVKDALSLLDQDERKMLKLAEELKQIEGELRAPFQKIRNWAERELSYMKRVGPKGYVAANAPSMPSFEPHEEVFHWEILQTNLFARSDYGDFTKHGSTWRLRKKFLKDATTAHFTTSYELSTARRMAWNNVAFSPAMNHKRQTAWKIRTDLRTIHSEYRRFRRVEVERLQTYIDTQREALGRLPDSPFELHCRCRFQGQRLELRRK